MFRTFKGILLVLLTLLFASAFASAQEVFVVDDDGDPLTTYPNLNAAIVTAATFPGGPHHIMVMEGTYSDNGLSITGASNIEWIYGDPAADKANIVFQAPTYQGVNFLDLGGTTGFTLEHLTVMDYGTAITGSTIGTLSILDVAFDNNGVDGSPAVGGAVFVRNCDGGLFDGLMVTNGTIGIRLDNISGPDGSDINMVSNSTFKDNEGMGVYVDFGTACDVSACQFIDNGNYGVSLSLNASTGTISGNCFYGQPGVQGNDNGTGNVWSNNFYGDHTGIGPYTLDGTAGSVDATPAVRLNNPEAEFASYEVFDNFVVDMNFYHAAGCATADSIPMALYEFTVSWDPAVLDYVAADNAGFLGASGDALYVITGDPSTGSLTFSGTNFADPNGGEGLMAWIEFQAITTTGATSVTVSSVYRDASNNDIPVGSTPLTLAVTDTEAPTITVVPNNPIGDDVYSDGSGDVQLFVEGVVTDNYSLDRVWYRFDNTGSWILIKSVSGVSDTYGGLPTDYYLDITGLAEGSHNVNIIVLDMAGNRDSVYYDFDIDRTGPDVANLALADSDGCADAGYTSSDVIDVSWDNPDGTATEHEFWYVSDPGWGKYGPTALANPTTFTLDGVEGTHQLYVRQYDVYGNVGGQTGPVSIILDKTAPNPSNFLLAGGAAKTNTKTINSDANEDVPNGTTEVAVSENSGDLTCAGATWLAAPIHPIPITLSDNDGIKTVYFVARDAAGNLSAILSDDIELDMTAPEFTSFNVTDDMGGECEADWAVTLTFEWTDMDVNFINIYVVDPTDITDTFFAAPVDISAETSPYSMLYTIPAGYRAANALNVVHAHLEDDINNVGGVAFDDVFVDRTNPTITSITARDLDYTDGITVHPEWSNSGEVALEIIGLAADVVELQFSETGLFTGEEVAFAVTSADPFAMNYTFGTVTDCGVHTVYVKAVDCAGRMSVVVSDGITIDLTDPVISAFDVTSANPTNALSVDLAQTLTDNCNAWKMQIFEDGYEGMGTGWIADAATWSGLALQDDGDGTRTIHIQFIDPAGNMAVGMTSVDVDQTVPTGSFSIQQLGNSWVTPGYTNSLSGCEAFDITTDADVVDMAIRDNDNTVILGWTALAASHGPVILGSDMGCGPYDLEIRFRDNANNYSAWIPATIEYRDPGVCAPAPPATATGVPGASVSLSWAMVPEAQYYYLKYNFTGQQPLFTDGVPPHPGGTSGDTLEGIFMTMESGTNYLFEAPHADIYAISIWTIDLAGNISNMPNTNVTETDYLLGDLDLDGEIEFVDDFGLFATSYSLIDTDPGFVDDADFGPTSDGSGTGYPIPDAVVNVEDLAIMGMNYTAYAKSSTVINRDSDNKVTVESRKLIATIERIDSDLYNVSISADQYDDIMLYHFVLDPGADAQVVSTKAGAGFENADESWFFHNTKNAGIDVTGIVMGHDEFTADELVRVTVTSATPLETLQQMELTVRDFYNNEIPVEFEVVAKLEVLPTEFALSQNYPNPFNPTTSIDLSLPVASDYTLRIFNVAGQVVDVINGSAEAGIVHVEWDASRYSSGIYFYRVNAGSFTETKKMVLLK